MKILIDTSVFISVFAKDEHYNKATNLLKRVLTKHHGIFCSMTINEIIWILKREKYGTEFINEKIDFIFSMPLKFLTSTYEVFRKSVELMEKCHLTYADSHIIAQ